MGCSSSKKESSPQDRKKPRSLPAETQVTCSSQLGNPVIETFVPDHEICLTPVSRRDENTPEVPRATDVEGGSGYFFRPFHVSDPEPVDSILLTQFDGCLLDKKLVKLINTKIDKIQSRIMNLPEVTSKEIIHGQHTDFSKLVSIYFYLRKRFQTEISHSTAIDSALIAEALKTYCTQSKLRCEIIRCHRRRFFYARILTECFANSVILSGRRFYLDLTLDLEKGLESNGYRKWIMSIEEFLIDHYPEDENLLTVVNPPTYDSFCIAPMVSAEYFTHRINLLTYRTYHVDAKGECEVDFAFKFFPGLGNYVTETRDWKTDMRRITVEASYYERETSKLVHKTTGFISEPSLNGGGTFIARVLFDHDQGADDLDVFMTVFSGKAPLFQHSVTNYGVSPKFLSVPQLLPEVLTNGAIQIPHLIMPNCGPLWTGSVINVKIKRGKFLSVRVRQFLDRYGKVSSDVVIPPEGDFFEASVYVAYKSLTIAITAEDEGNQELEREVYRFEILNPGQIADVERPLIPDFNFSIDSHGERLVPKVLEFKHGIQSVSHFNPIIDLKGGFRADFDFLIPSGVICLPMLTSNVMNRKIPENVLIQREGDGCSESQVSVTMANRSNHVLTLLAKKRSAADRYEEVARFLLENGGVCPKDRSLPRVHVLESTRLLSPLEGTLKEGSWVEFEVKTPVQCDWQVRQGGSFEPMEAVGRIWRLKTEIKSSVRTISVGFVYGKQTFKVFAEFKVSKS